MKYMTGEERTASILEAAVQIAVEKGYRFATRADVAERAGCSQALVSLYFGRVDSLHDAVMHEAIARRLPALVLQGLVARDPIAMGAPKFLQQQAQALLLPAEEGAS